MSSTQLPLGREVTCRDIVALTCKQLATDTHALGNAALGYIIGHADTYAGFAALDAACLANDLDQTKLAGRALIRAVRSLLAEHGNTERSRV